VTHRRLFGTVRAVRGSSGSGSSTTSCSGRGGARPDVAWHGGLSSGRRLGAAVRLGAAGSEPGTLRHWRLRVLPLDIGARLWSDLRGGVLRLRIGLCLGLSLLRIAVQRVCRRVFSTVLLTTRCSFGAR